MMHEKIRPHHLERKAILYVIGLDLIGQLSDWGVRLRALTGLLSRQLRWLGYADRSSLNRYNLN